MTDNAKVDFTKVSAFPSVPTEDWDDWHWQLRHSTQTLDDLVAQDLLTHSRKQELEENGLGCGLSIPPYYIGLMKSMEDNEPLSLQALPSVEELCVQPGESEDPLDEEASAPCQSIVHRYPDRVVFLLTHRCAMYCRHCMRKRNTCAKDVAAEDIKEGLDYIRNTPQVRDVLISGGDPLMLEDHELKSVLDELRGMPHVEIIRIGTRMPVVLPQRITDELVGMLKAYQPVYINTHFNHPTEITQDASAACGRLVDAGIPVGNQTVLLKGVNDDPEIMKDLMRGLLRIRVRPYYIHQCDMTAGLSHFRTTLQCGLDIMKELRGHISGLAVPTYALDLPGGGGKVPLQPEYLVSETEGTMTFLNYEGKQYQLQCHP